MTFGYKKSSILQIQWIVLIDDEFTRCLYLEVLGA